MLHAILGLSLCISYAIAFLDTGGNSFSRSKVVIESSRRPKATSASTNTRRQELLSRNGPHFRLDRFRGKVEFGATAKLVTELGSGANNESISTWLRDERGLAQSIWDPSLIKDLGNSIYRLQVMKLQFVTLQLAPWVDVEMSTIQGIDDSPVFVLQSVGFDPNIEVLPGMRVSADALGILIEVSGELRASPDGRGVAGGVAFQTSGELPPPMRVLPEAALKAASDAINQTIVRFAVQSFQKGATANFKAFLRSK
jgi:hypothetical protein